MSVVVTRDLVGAPKWGGVNKDTLSDAELKEFVEDSFGLYEQNGFKATFLAPHEDDGGHNGMKFTILRRASYRNEHGDLELDMKALPAWLVKFENGDIAFCYPEEICKPFKPGEFAGLGSRIFGYINKSVSVFTLAEKACFWDLIYNALGWKPEPTYDIPDFHYVHDQDQPIKVLRKFVEFGGEIKVRHLFKPFMPPKDDLYMRGFYDDSFRLLRLFFSFKGEFPVIWDFDLGDDETLEELNLLCRQSPPLYDRVMKQFAVQFRDSLKERIRKEVSNLKDTFYGEHQGTALERIAVLLSPTLDDVYCDTWDEDFYGSPFYKGWSVETITDTRQIDSLSEKYSRLIAGGILAPYLLSKS